jgi:hypothetical protein
MHCAVASACEHDFGTVAHGLLRLRGCGAGRSRGNEFGSMAKAANGISNVLKQLRALSPFAARRGIVDEYAVHVIILLLDEREAHIAGKCCAI